MSLMDIDELVELVRSSSAKSFIREAVDCYRASAYRSAIVATWIALIYDFVDKFRDLALSGDTAAQVLVAEFDRIQKQRDTASALKFEREVLDIAKDEYELLSSQEYVDLKRLFEDRNRFGHPNINQDAEMLGATPELARTHLRNAVEHVMARPPVQGKVAIQAVRAAVESPYFPRGVEDAVAALSATPLIRAKRALIKDFFLGCIMSLLREKPAAEAFERIYAASVACARMHRSVVDEVIHEKMQGVLEKTGDENLGYLVLLLERMPDLIDRVSPALKVRLKGYIKNVPEKELPVVNFAAFLSFLVGEVEERLKSVTPGQLQSFVQRSASKPCRPVIDRSIEMLNASTSWDSSNAVSSAISEKMLEFLSAADAERILQAASNHEVKWSFNYPPLIMKLVERALLSADRVREAAASVEATALIAALDG